MSVLLMACDDPEPAIGVLTTTSGQLVLIYNPCNETKEVTSVMLETPNAVLWRITAEGSLAREFFVGQANEGFSTVVALTAPVPSNGPMRAEINGVGPQYFRSSDLVTGQVFVVNRGVMSKEEFLSRNTCD
jgi:hypothetical protein